MRLRHAIWQKLQPSPASPKTLDMVALAEQLGQLPQLQRKPWVILNDCRADFESALGLSTDALLITLASWLEDSCVGLAHVSGNVYLGPPMNLVPARSLAPEQVLLGNLFSHGEIGLDAIASPNLPDDQACGLLAEVATYPSLRWLCSSAQRSEAVAPSLTVTLQPEKPRQVGDIVKPVRRSLLKTYPALRDMIGDPSGKHGNCLQHASFRHYDLRGDTLEEYQASAARIAAKRAYAPASRPTAGCALKTEAGLFSGSEVATRTGQGALTPLECALISLGANGLDCMSILSAVWCQPSEEQNILEMREHDRSLLMALSPNAPFDTVHPE